MFDEIFVFIFGLIFGSLANLIIFRLRTFEPLFWGGSKCLYCAKKLKWFELIPIISFLIQKGRCRTCKSKISFQYPIVELLTGLLFLLIWLKWQGNIFLLFWWLGFWYLLFLASIYDLKHQILPEEFILPGLLLAIFGNFFFFPQFFINSLLTGLSIFLFFILVWFLTKKKGMGFGDSKMALGFGIFLGFPQAIFGLILSFWLGAIVGLILLFLKKANLKTPFPFGPFLFLGNFVIFLSNFQFPKFF